MQYRKTHIFRTGLLVIDILVSVAVFLLPAVWLLDILIIHLGPMTVSITRQKVCAGLPGKYITKLLSSGRNSSSLPRKGYI